MKFFTRYFSYLVLLASLSSPALAKKRTYPPESLDCHNTLVYFDMLRHEAFKERRNVAIAATFTIPFLVFPPAYLAIYEGVSSNVKKLNHRNVKRMQAAWILRNAPHHPALEKDLYKADKYLSRFYKQFVRRPVNRCPQVAYGTCSGTYCSNATLGFGELIARIDHCNTILFSLERLRHIPGQDRKTLTRLRNSLVRNLNGYIATYPCIQDPTIRRDWSKMMSAIIRYLKNSGATDCQVHEAEVILAPPHTVDDYINLLDRLMVLIQSISPCDCPLVP